MRAIDKGAAPPCLADRQRELDRKVKETGRPPEPGDWEPKDCAQPIREALWRDQFGLCGYCTQRIETTPHVDGKIPPSRGMRIEHIVTREDEAARMYEWANLLGVCGGRSSSAAGVSYDHCDRARGDQPLHIDPTRKTPDPESAFDYHRAKKPPGAAHRTRPWARTPRGGHRGPEAQQPRPRPPPPGGRTPDRPRARQAEGPQETAQVSPATPGCRDHARLDRHAPGVRAGGRPVRQEEARRPDRPRCIITSMM